MTTTTLQTASHAPTALSSGRSTRQWEWSDGSGGVGVEQEAFKEEVGCWNPDVFCNIYIVSEIADNDGGNGVQGYAYLGPNGRL